MYRVIENISNEINNFETLKDAVEFVTEKVKQEAYLAYDDNLIDKYGLEDILFDNVNYIEKNMGYYHDDLPNIDFEIKEMNENKSDCNMCERCKNFYECDNMGLYEECLPLYKHLKE